MSGGRVGAYLDQLTRALRARGAYSRDFIDEVHDHLLDSVEAAERRGLSVAAAEEEALTRMGGVATVVRHAAAHVPRGGRRLLLAICAATMSAIAYLSLSLLILRPPRARYGNWSAEAAAVLVLSALTFAWVKTGGLPRWVRPLLVLGSLGLAAVGGAACYAALAGDFEGYRVVLGALFGLQAALTLIHLLRQRRGTLVPR